MSPTISVEVDGNLLPPATVNKLAIFMVNVLRFRGKGDAAALVEAANHGPDLVVETGEVAAATEAAIKAARELAAEKVDA